MKRAFAIISAFLPLIGFFVAANHHAQREFNMSMVAMWNSPDRVLEVFQFMSPCIILCVTTLAYYRYVVDYTGVIAGWSFIGFLAAWICCSELLEASPSDWTAHILWVYVLFLTYAWWDAVMLLWFLPSAKDRDMVREDEEEIFAITSMINWPTLGALLLIWFCCVHIATAGRGALVGCYVNGVVAFHLVFASVLAALNMRLTPQHTGIQRAMNPN